MRQISQAPIGVFDSGVGGLTVVQAIQRELPLEQIIYLGDVARLPYGTKSSSIITQYACNCSRFLVDQGAKIIVVACNSASATALPTLQKLLPIPVIGVILSGATAAITATSNLRIGIIATEATLKSCAYQEALAEYGRHINIFSAACPLFVPLAEEAMHDHPATRMIAEQYLQPLLQEDIDTLVLGCTHYPILQPIIEQVCGSSVRVINSANQVARAVRQLLALHRLLASHHSAHRNRYWVTDITSKAHAVAQLFLDDPSLQLELTNLTLPYSDNCDSNQRRSSARLEPRREAKDSS